MHGYNASTISPSPAELSRSFSTERGFNPPTHRRPRDQAHNTRSSRPRAGNNDDKRDQKKNEKLIARMNRSLQQHAQTGRQGGDGMVGDQVAADSLPPPGQSRRLHVLRDGANTVIEEDLGPHQMVVQPSLSPAPRSHAEVLTSKSNANLEAAAALADSHRHQPVREKSRESAEVPRQESPNDQAFEGDFRETPHTLFGNKALNTGPDMAVQPDGDRNKSTSQANNKLRYFAGESFRGVPKRQDTESAANAKTNSLKLDAQQQSEIHMIASPEPSTQNRDQNHQGAQNITQSAECKKYFTPNLGGPGDPQGSSNAPQSQSFLSHMNSSQAAPGQELANQSNSVTTLKLQENPTAQLTTSRRSYSSRRSATGGHSGEVAEPGLTRSAVKEQEPAEAEQDQASLAAERQLADAINRVPMTTIELGQRSSQLQLQRQGSSFEEVKIPIAIKNQDSFAVMTGGSSSVPMKSSEGAGPLTSSKERDYSQRVSQLELGSSQSNVNDQIQGIAATSLSDQTKTGARSHQHQQSLSMLQVGQQQQLETEALQRQKAYSQMPKQNMVAVAPQNSNDNEAADSLAAANSGYQRPIASCKLPAASSNAKATPPVVKEDNNQDEDPSPNRFLLPLYQANARNSGGLLPSISPHGGRGRRALGANQAAGAGGPSSINPEELKDVQMAMQNNPGILAMIRKTQHLAPNMTSGGVDINSISPQLPVINVPQPFMMSNSPSFKPCNCKRTGCFKLYCDCLRAGLLCSDKCKCVGCKNGEPNEQREKLLNLVKAKVDFSSPTPHHGSCGTPTRGCHCKKSGCLKNYCECFQNGQPCSQRCNCSGCHNTNMQYIMNRRQARNSATPSSSGTLTPSASHSAQSSAFKSGAPTFNAHAMGALFQSSPQVPLVPYQPNQVSNKSGTTGGLPREDDNVHFGSGGGSDLKINGQGVARSLFAVKTTTEPSMGNQNSFSGNQKSSSQSVFYRLQESGGVPAIQNNSSSIMAVLALGEDGEEVHGDLEDYEMVEDGPFAAQTPPKEAGFTSNRQGGEDGEAQAAAVFQPPVKDMKEAKENTQKGRQKSAAPSRRLSKGSNSLSGSPERHTQAQLQQQQNVRQAGAMKVGDKVRKGSGQLDQEQSQEEINQIGNSENRRSETAFLERQEEEDKDQLQNRESARLPTVKVDQVNKSAVRRTEDSVEGVNQSQDPSLTAEGADEGTEEDPDGSIATRLRRGKSSAQRPVSASRQKAARTGSNAAAAKKSSVKSSSQQQSRNSSLGASNSAVVMGSAQTAQQMQQSKVRTRAQKQCKKPETAAGAEAAPPTTSSNQ